MDVVVNAAMSADGKLSTVNRDRIEISGPADFERVDTLRTNADAIGVGIGTVRADDPTLTVDNTHSADSPARVVFDSKATISPDARILTCPPRTIILVSEAAPDNRIDELTARHVEVITAGDTRVDPVEVIPQLEKIGIESLLIEGGGELIFSLFAADIVDTLIVYIGNCVIGGATAPTLADGPGFTQESAFPVLTLTDMQPLDKGVVLSWDVDRTRP